MFDHRSLKWPITLGVVMIVLVIVLLVGWVLVNAFAAVGNRESAGAYWTSLALGTVVLGCILAGVIVYLVLSVRAISLNRRQSNFVDSVTHELKSPIASLKLYLQTLSRRQVSDEQRHNFQQFMLADVERLDQLINHLLDAARVDRGAINERWEDCRLDEVLTQCVDNTALRYKLPPEAIVVDADPMVVRANPVDLSIVFRNLIDNATKYGGSPPEVRVTARWEEGQGHVLILDNGPGIPRHLRRKIFGRFVRLGDELERSRQGTGLGLYLVRTVVRSLGGVVRVRDRRGQSGTEFEVILPDVRPAGRPQPTAETGRPASTLVGESSPN